MTDTCGLTSCEPFARWDRDSQSWRTSEATSLWDLELSSLTLPAWGGLHDGELCEHPTPERLTSGLDYSSLPTPAAIPGASDLNFQVSGDGRTKPNKLGWAIGEMLPTPTTDDAGNITRESGAFQSLTRSVRELPTPTSRDWKGHNQRGDDTCLTGALLPTPTSQAAKHGELSPIEREGNRPQDNGNLWVVMPRLAEEALLPTPVASTQWDDATPEQFDEWRAKQKANHGNGNGHGNLLVVEAKRMGATTAPQSPDGSTSSDDPHPHLLSLDGQGIPA